jgi:ribonucleoside-diphosphate reductase beta chain
MQPGPLTMPPPLSPAEEILAAGFSGAHPLPAYRDLYRRWEKDQWSVYDLDFTVDRQQWAQGTAEEKDFWYRLGRFPGFYLGEQSVADALGPYLAALSGEEERIVLATQIADEARHVVFFDRFFQEVLGLAPGEGKGLPAPWQTRSPAFQQIVLNLLPAVVQRLRQEPQNGPLLVEAVTLYHLIIEATLALDHQRLVLRELKRRGLFPGFQTGFGAVFRDEVRHVLFGLRWLRDRVVKRPADGETILGCVARVFPLLFQILGPAGNSSSSAAALSPHQDRWPQVVESLERRLQAIGLAVRWSQRRGEATGSWQWAA